ncbi:MAG: peroxidase-related enzyme [Alphaproteobacteria bacterium]
MSRVAPLDPKDIPELMEIFDPVIERMGFIPNSQLVMAYKPDLLRAFIALGRAVYAQEDGSIPFALKNLIGAVGSKAAGCRYCTAHTASNANRSGIDDDKIAAIWEFETSDLFSEAERAALSFAQAASQVPNMTTEADFAELRKHFTEFQIVEIMSVIAMFGYLNRWNDTMATTLEEEPTAFAEATIADAGWSAGKHV